MKHTLFTVMIFLLFSGVMHAQHVNIGIKGGLNGYNIKGDNSSNYDPKIGYHVGLLGHIHWDKRFALQPEIVYSLQGTKTKIAGSDLSLNMSYVNIPILLQYMFDNGFRLQAGPQLGILTGAKSVTGSVKNDVKDNYKSTDLGITLGMSYVKPSSGFGFDIRYNHGFTNINESNTMNAYNRGIQVGLFYLFRHRP